MSPRPSIETTSASPLRPLLKWVGGKRQLLPQLRRFYPDRFERYIEPFFGSGAVFFDLCGAGLLEGHEVVLIDSNADLIGCYETVRDDPEKVIAELDALAEGHARGGSGHYYAVRNERFNPMRAAQRRSDGAVAYTPELAAMLIYLNRTGFNGLFRLNASGSFNVPAGRYVRPRISEPGRILSTATALRRPGVRLLWGSFDAVEKIAARGDFVYVDPPYAPLSRTASFTSYTASRFTHDDQRRVQQLAVALASRGCSVVLSNSTAPEMIRLYEDRSAVVEARLRTYRVRARRAINADASGRGVIEELLVSNVSPETRSIGRRPQEPCSQTS